MRCSTILISVVLLGGVLGSLGCGGGGGRQSLNGGPSYKRVLTWGSEGGAGQLWDIAGLALDSAGNVYVVDARNERVKKFTDDGVLLTSWFLPATTEGGERGAAGIGVDASDRPYVPEVCDHGSNPRLQKFASDGELLADWGLRRECNQVFPSGIGVAPNGTLYVTEECVGQGRHYYIQQWTGDGQFVRRWACEGDGGPFAGVAVEANGDVLVANRGDHCIDEYTANGQFLVHYGSPGRDDGEFDQPWDVAVDADGNFYVTDYGNHRVQKFDSGGRFLTKWIATNPMDIDVDAEGNVYVSDSDNDYIQKFSPSL